MCRRFESCRGHRHYQHKQSIHDRFILAVVLHVVRKVYARTMTEAKSGRRNRRRGEVEELPSGALRVKVYAGEDALTGRRHYLRETVPAGPTAARDAERARARLLNQVDEGRNPRTKATVNQLMDRYLELLEVDAMTFKSYEGYIRNHIRPLLGRLPLSRLRPPEMRRVVESKQSMIV